MKPLVHWVQTIVLLTLHVPVLGKSVIVKAAISLLYEHCILNVPATFSQLAHEISVYTCRPLLNCFSTYQSKQTAFAKFVQ